MSQEVAMSSVSVRPLIIEEGQTSDQAREPYDQIIGPQHTTMDPWLGQPIATVVQPNQVSDDYREANMLEKLIRLGPPRFSNALGEDAYEFLVSY